MIPPVQEEKLTKVPFGSVRNPSAKCSKGTELKPKLRKGLGTIF